MGKNCNSGDFGGGFSIVLISSGVAAFIEFVGRAKRRITELGTEQVRQWRVFRNYIVEIINEKKNLDEYMSYFDNYLPYAILIQAGTELVKTFLKANRPIPVPYWYDPDLIHSGFTDGVSEKTGYIALVDVEDGFVKMLNDFDKIIRLDPRI